MTDEDPNAPAVVVTAAGGLSLAPQSRQPKCPHCGGYSRLYVVDRTAEKYALKVSFCCPLAALAAEEAINKNKEEA